MKKKLLIVTISLLVISTAQGQSIQEKIAAKLAAKMEKSQKNKKVKYEEPYEEDFSDESGISGAYYTASELKTNTGKNVKIVKIDYNGKDKLTFHTAKEDKSVFWIADYHLYALNTYGHYEFDYKRTLHIYNVEPGVLVVGGNNEAAFKSVVLVKDTSMLNNYTYEDAIKLLAEGIEKQEKYNR